MNILNSVNFPLKNKVYNKKKIVRKFCQKIIPTTTKRKLIIFLYNKLGKKLRNNKNFNFN